MSLRVLLLGASGVLGRRVAAELARRPQFGHVTLAGRDAHRLDRFVRVLGPEKSSARRFDIEDRAELTRAIEDVDVVVSAAGPGYLLEGPSLRSAIDAGKPYVSANNDTSSTREALRSSEAAEDAGVAAVTGCGCAPGLSNLLAALAATALDDVHDIAFAAASASRDDSGPASGFHTFATFGDPEERKGLPSTPHAPSPMYFPDPVGWVETFEIPHPELLATSDQLKQHVSGFRFGLSEKPVMDVVRAAAAVGAFRTHEMREALWKVGSASRGLLEALPPRGSAWSALRVDARGLKDGVRTTVSLGTSDRLMNLAAIPLVHAAEQLGAGSVTPGVHSADAAFETRPFLAEVARRGIRIARLEPHDL